MKTDEKQKIADQERKGKKEKSWSKRKSNSKSASNEESKSKSESKEKEAETERERYREREREQEQEHEQQRVENKKRATKVDSIPKRSSKCARKSEMQLKDKNRRWNNRVSTWASRVLWTIDYVQRVVENETCNGTIRIVMKKFFRKTRWSGCYLMFASFMLMLSIDARVRVN